MSLNTVQDGSFHDRQTPEAPALNVPLLVILVGALVALGLVCPFLCNRDHRIYQRA